MAQSRLSYLWKYMFLALAVGLLMFSALGGRYSLMRIYRLRTQRDQVKKDILQLSEENQSLRKEIEALRSDPEYIARIAREDLGLAKPGEIIYRYHQIQKEKPAQKVKR